jgi:DNA-binding GntR family transcriptional regulator
MLDEKALSRTTAHVRRIGTETQQSRVFQELARALLFGAFAPGEMVSVKSLCDQLGAGTMPVRESIQRLVGLGALDSFPNRTLRVPYFTREEFDELCEAREALEGMAAARAARYADGDFPQALATELRLLDQRVSANDIDGALRQNVSLHFAIYEQARSSHILPFIEAMWLRLGPLLRIPFETGTALRHEFLASRDLHEELIAAIAAGVPAAAAKALRGIIRQSAKWYRHNYEFAPSNTANVEKPVRHLFAAFSPGPPDFAGASAS